MGYAMGMECGCCCTPTIGFGGAESAYNAILADAAVSDGCKTVLFLIQNNGAWCTDLASYSDRIAFYSGTFDGKKTFTRTGRADGIEAVIEWDVAGQFFSSIAITKGSSFFTATRSSAGGSWSGSTNCGCGQLAIGVGKSVRAVATGDAGAKVFTISRAGVTTGCSAQPSSLAAVFSVGISSVDGYYGVQGSSSGGTANWVSSPGIGVFASQCFLAPGDSLFTLRFGCPDFPGCGSCDTFKVQANTSVFATLVGSGLNRHCLTDFLNFTTSDVTYTQSCTGCSASSPSLTVVES